LTFTRLDSRRARRGLRHDRVSRIGSGDEAFRFELSYGRGLDPIADGTLVFRTLHNGLHTCLTFEDVQINSKKKPRERGFCRALFRTRTLDPLLTI
jgi:hypothetical protein